MIKESNFWKLFAGRSVSNVGDSLYTVGLSWYIFSISHSAFWVGVLNAAIFCPNLFSFLFGNIISKSNKRNLLVAIEAAQGLMLLLAILTISMVSILKVRLFSLCTVAFVISSVGMNAYIIQDTLMPNLVPREKLASASMYMSFSYHSMDYIGNALGGILVRALGIVGMLWIDIGTFIVSALSFSQIGSNNKDNSSDDAHSDIEIKPNAYWLLRRQDLLIITAFAGLSNFMYGGLAVYDVLIGKQLGGAAAYGILLATESLGATIGSTVLAKTLLMKYRLGSLIWFSGIGSAIGILIVSLTNVSIWTIVFWGIAFAFQGLGQVAVQPYLQATVSDEKRANFFSLYNTLTVSPIPAGALVFGMVSDSFTWRNFIILFAAIWTVQSLFFRRNLQIRNYSG